MNNSFLTIMMIVAGVGLVAIVIFYFLLNKRMNKEDLKYYL